MTLQDTLGFASIPMLGLGVGCCAASGFVTLTVRRSMAASAREMQPDDEVTESLRSVDFDDFDAWTARLALLMLLDEALADKKVVAALAGEEVPRQEVHAQLVADDALLTRIRIEQDRSVSAGKHQLSVTSPLASLRGGQYFWLAITAILGVGYISLMRAAWPLLSLPMHVFAIVGFCAVAALSTRMLARRVPDVLAIPRPSHQTEPHPDLLRIGDRGGYLLAEVVVPAVLDYARVHRSRRHGTALVLNGVSGLREAESAETLMTAGAERLRRIIERTDSGAVALAGSRGVGKTTAIEAMRHGRLTTAGEPPLVVMASAPANYEARDFVLHLHALLCRTVIDKTNEALLPFWPLSKRSIGAVLRQGAARLLRFLLFAGFALGAAVLLWGAPLSRFPVEIAALLTTAVADLPVSAGVLWESQPTAHIITLALIALVAWRLTLALVLAPFDLLTRSGIRRRHRDLFELRSAAVRQLAQTRFLQTYTTGWSGKLSLPLKGEAGRTWSTQRAEQQLTHPEVVETLRSFAAETSRALRKAGLIERMVIAIDELDKIGEPEKAHQFINDIKGVFGVSGCLFFVSVSDDAVLNFEQRGLGIRDAFDSAFSEMVRLDHFTLDESRRWMASRVEGITEQFCYLCHCLSGGLPRDLRRYAVEMVDVAATVHQPSLATVTETLVRRDLSSKIHALTALTTTLDTTPEHVALTARLLAIPDTGGPLELARIAVDLVEESAEGSVNETDALRWNAACFTLFCATLLEVFGNDLDQDQLSREFHHLALARRQMAAHPHLAWRRIVDFRKARDLDPGVQVEA
ncbi:hypothetical protein ABZU76_31800 [Amycolatopsis sp. NPDC005232]|uniref:hypothetical protein n=1 Tax=Amycolatopsis sp. NPDC005232 TaxID=3157027 RepID=UPI0033B867EE